MSMISMMFSLALAATAPQAAPQTPATELADIVVQGRRVDEQVRRFIDEVAAPASGKGPARWRDGVCVGVANIRGAAAQVVADRVSQAAMDIGLTPGEPGCTPNILIIGASDGAAIAKGLVEARRSVFWPGGAGMNRSRSALDAFQSSDQPVRWWHISTPIDPRTGRLATRLPGEDAPVVEGGLASRLRSTIRNDLNRVIIILDVTKAEGLNFNQLADYMSMVALAQVDPDANADSYDTVLRLFDDHQIQGLTEWDRAYLKALYSSELNQTSPTHQLGEIRSLMARERRQAEGVESDQP